MLNKIILAFLETFFFFLEKIYCFKEFLLLVLKYNINHKGLQRTANEYAEERRIYKDLISKNSNVDILNSDRTT